MLGTFYERKIQSRLKRPRPHQVLLLVVPLYAGRKVSRPPL